MKKSFFVLLMIGIGSSAVAQSSLKEALFSGKLKNNNGLMVTKANLKSNIDTSAERQAYLKALAVAEKARLDSINRVVPKENVIEETTERAKINAGNWKDFIAQLQDIIETEVLPSSRIKTGYYSVLIDYEIGLTGEVTVNSVKSDPSVSFLENQIKEIITYEAPKFTPELNAQGKPRVVKRKQLLSLKK